MLSKAFQVRFKTPIIIDMHIAQMIERGCEDEVQTKALHEATQQLDESLVTEITLGRPITPRNGLGGLGLSLSNGLLQVQFPASTELTREKYMSGGQIDSFFMPRDADVLLVQIGRVGIGMITHSLDDLQYPDNQPLIRSYSFSGGCQFV
jgi:hypothetical protein